MHHGKHQQILDPSLQTSENYHFLEESAHHKNASSSNNREASRDNIRDGFVDHSSKFKRQKTTKRYPRAGFGCVDQKRLMKQISQTISSADRAIKAILPYGHIEIEKYFSDYFLNREKLYSFLDYDPIVQSNSPEQTKTTQKNRQTKTDDYQLQWLTQSVPINHLQRLEKIVFKKIIPILEADLRQEKKRGHKTSKRGKQTMNGDFKEGLALLEKLKENEKIVVDDCAEILEQFIRKTIEKEEKMIAKLGKLHQKLDFQMKKADICSEQSRKWDEERKKAQKELNKQKKTSQKYQQFSKEIRSMFVDGGRISAELTQKESFQQILKHVRHWLSGQEKVGKKEKRCDHKNQVHSACKQQISRSQQQIRNLKDVVKALDCEIGVLRDECESMQGKLQNSNDKLNKLDSKTKKIIEENESSTTRIEEMNRELHYKSKILEDYLQIIGRLQEVLKLNEDEIFKLKEQNDEKAEIIAKCNCEKEGYVMHIMEIEEKEKELQEALEKKQVWAESLLQNLYEGERQVDQLQKKNSLSLQRIQELELGLQQLKQEIAKLQQQRQKSKADEDKRQLNKRQQLIKQQSMSNLINTAQDNLAATVIQSYEAPQNVKRQRSDFIPGNVNKEVLLQVQVDRDRKQANEAPQQIIAANEVPNQPPHADSDDKEPTINQQINFIPKADSLQIIQAHCQEKPDPIVTTLPEEELIRNTCILSQKSSPLYSSQKRQSKEPKSQMGIQIPQQIKQLLSLNEKMQMQLIIFENKLREYHLQQVESIRALASTMYNFLNQCTLSIIKTHQKNDKNDRGEADNADKLQTNNPTQHYNENVSWFIIPNHLQSHFRHNTFFGDKNSQQNNVHRIFSSKQIHTQTGLWRPAFKYTEPVQSEVIAYQKSPLNSNNFTQEIRQFQEIDMAKSFIDDLGSMNIGLIGLAQRPRLQSMVQYRSDNDNFNTNSLRRIPSQRRTLKEDFQPINRDQLREIMFMIDFHREQLLRLQNILKQQSVQIQSTKQQEDYHTPKRPALLENESYLNYIVNAPAKSDKNQLENGISQVKPTRQFNEVFEQREQEYEKLVLEKDQEIQRLKAIILNITKTHNAEEKPSLKSSQNKEANREIDRLRSENEDLWQFSQKQKIEIERLQILIKQYELSEQLFKATFRTGRLTNKEETLEEGQAKYPQQLALEDQIDQINPEARHPLPQNDLSNDLDHLYPELPNEQKIDLRQDQLNQVVTNRQVEIPSKQIDSPSKRFARKTETFQDEKVARERRHTSPTITFDWQGLMPQFFNQKHKKR